MILRKFRLGAALVGVLSLGILATVPESSMAGADTPAATTTIPAPGPGATAADVAVYAMQQELDGNFDVAWGLIDPAQTSQLNQNDWGSCGLQAWIQVEAATILSVTPGKQQPVTEDFGPVKNASATKVTLNVKLKAGGNTGTATPFLYVTQANGTSSVLLQTADFNALKARNCPGGLGSTASNSSSKFAQADMNSAYWFAMTSSFAGAGQFSDSDPLSGLPSDPYSKGDGRLASLQYDGPSVAGQEQGVMIKALGPESSPAPHSPTATSLAQAGKLWSNGLKQIKGPFKTTLGGKPALGYSGVNDFGNAEWLVVTYVKGHSLSSGVYTLALTAPASSINQYKKGFSEIQSSFELLH